MKAVNTLRSVDVLTRYGGEEFAVLLKDLNVSGAQHIAERIRSVIADAEIISDEKVIPVTVSIGISELTLLNAPELDADKLAYQLTEAADSALYQAKENGRDRVITAK